MRTFLRPLLVCGLLLSSHAFAAPAADAHFVGPPLLTEAGCSADREWNAEYVQGVLKETPSTIRRLTRRYGLGPQAVCQLSRHDLERFVKLAHDPKRNYDEPDKAMEHRMLSLVDESGVVRPNGLAIALDQRDENVRATGGKRGGKAAGVTSVSWAALGPSNVGGRVRAIAPHPTISGRILAGSVSGGLFKSTDAGANWAPVSTATQYLPSVAIACLVHDPNNSNTMYACTGEGAFNVDAVRGLGIFKSTDMGETWAQMATTNPATAGTQWYFVNRIAVHPTNALVILAATNNGVYRTADGGATWTSVYGDIPTVGNRRRVYDVKFNPTGTIAVLGEHNYFNGATGQVDGGATAKSVDGGVTWVRTAIAPVPLAGNFGRVELAYSLSTGNWYASLDNDLDTVTAPPAGMVYKSTDGGSTWTLRSQPGHTSGQGWYDNTIWVAPNDDNRVIVGGVTLHMSLNGGTTFANIDGSTNFIHTDHHALVEHPLYTANGIVYLGNDGGIFQLSSVQNVITPSGSSPVAISRNNGLAITQFYGGAGGSIPSVRIAGGTQDNGSYVYNGTTATWIFVFGGDGGEGAVDPTDSNYSYGEVQFLNVHRNTTGGTGSNSYICSQIVDSSCAGGPVKVVDTNFIAPIALDPSDPNRLYAGGAQLWRSLNAKDPTATNVSFSSIKPKTAAGTSAGRLAFIAVAPSDPNVIWVGQNDGQVFRTVNGLNATPTWTANISPVAGRQVLRILIDPVDPAKVYLAFGGFSSNNVQVTSNGLAASPIWTPRAGSGGTALPQAPVRALTRHPNSDLWLYAGTEVGLFTSEDGGVTWNAANDGPGTVSVEEIFFLNASTMVASTHGRGMFQATVTPPASSPGTLAFTLNSVGVLEGAQAQLSISRSGGTAGAVTVNVNTVAGTATSPADYTAITNQVVSWAAADATTKTVNIQTAADVDVEGTQSFTVTLSGQTGGATLGTPSTATVSIADPDLFPAGCLMPPGTTVPGTASAGWAIATDAIFEGGCSMKSMPITHNQKAQIQYTATFNAGNITFRRRVHAESGWDFFRFFIDGVEQGGQSCPLNGAATCSGATATGPTATGTFTSASDSGPTEWNQPSALLSIPITAGVHTILFSYEKDEIISHGADAAWIDMVTLPITPPTFNLTVTNAGAGGGIVTSIPAGISCPGTCVAPFAANTGVTLSAAPNGGSTFAGWSVGCAGTGGCSVTMSAAQAVTATFNVAAATLAKPADFDGNGTADVTWKDASGQAAMWLQNGTTTTGSGLLLGPATGWSVLSVEGDFNGDGRADLLWVNTDGSVAMWLMNGASPTDYAIIFGPGTGWSPTHVADLNGDSRSDIVWKHTDGSVSAWLMNGMAAASSGIVLGPGTGFVVTLTGDLDADGRADLLFKHADGRVSLWLMNGLTVANSSLVLGAGSVFTPTHLADLDGDGRKDIVFRNTVDNSVSGFLMNGIAVVGSGFILGPGSGWTVTGTGKFDAGATDDIVWKHTDGSVALWLMNGVVPSSSSLVFGPGTDWIVTHVRDYSGDNRADMLWRHTSTGMVALWTFNGIAVTGSALLFGGSGGWLTSP